MNMSNAVNESSAVNESKLFRSKRRQNLVIGDDAGGEMVLDSVDKLDDERQLLVRV